MHTQKTFLNLSVTQNRKIPPPFFFQMEEWNVFWIIYIEKHKKLDLLFFFLLFILLLEFVEWQLKVLEFNYWFSSVFRCIVVMNDSPEQIQKQEKLSLHYQAGWTMELNCNKETPTKILIGHFSVRNIIIQCYCSHSRILLIY